MAIAIAHQAQARRLALIHFSPELYPTPEDRRKVQMRFAPQSPGLLAATDGLTIDV
jgi:ribonuclease BN (tRNA processing enzyme)